MELARSMSSKDLEQLDKWALEWVHAKNSMEREDFEDSCDRSHQAVLRYVDPRP